MLEIYEIVWRNDEVTGYLEYNEKADKFQAYLKDGMRPNPCGLFGVIKKDKVIDDRRVRAYIDSCVVPKTRENIDDILKHMNMPYPKCPMMTYRIFRIRLTHITKSWRH